MKLAPWLVLLLAIAVNVVSYVLVAFDAMSLGETGIATVTLVIGFVGALVASKRGGNGIGWVFLLLCLSLAVNSFAVGYAEAAENRPDLPGAAYAEWLGDWLTLVWISLAATFVPMLFPTGRPLTPNWRPALWLAIGATTLGVTASALRPGALNDSTPWIENPVGIAGTHALMSALIDVGNLLAALCFILACISMVLRFRRSQGKERLQMKWFTLVALIMVICILMAIVQVILGDDEENVWLNAIGTAGWLGFLIMVACGLPLAVGVAILNHRLFDIDRLINRTIVYAVLTAMLAATYAGLVIGLQELLRPLSGSSDLAIVITTLTVAALAMPARTRVQETVDRRFNRQAYNSAHTIDLFSARLRDQIDLDTLRYELLSVVDETMQPALANVWLRKEART